MRRPAQARVGSRHHTFRGIFDAVRRSILALACVLVSACSGSHDIRIRVQLAEDVAVPTGATIAFVVVPHESVDGAPVAPESWSPRVQLPANQGMRTYQGKAAECCKPNPIVSMHAFIDLDGDHTLDPDEPRGSDPAGPVTLGDAGTEHRSSIVITRAF